MDAGDYGDPIAANAVAILAGNEMVMIKNQKKDAMHLFRISSIFEILLIVKCRQKLLMVRHTSFLVWLPLRDWWGS
jgi:hypothetical protein